MRVFVPAHHAKHHPQLDYSDGLPAFEHLEVATRVHVFAAGLERAGLEPAEQVEAEARDAVRAIHAADYCDFLDAVGADLGTGEEYLPPVFGQDLSAAPLAFRGGMYCREVGTPIGPHSVRAALNSAATAQTAARAIVEGEPSAFALCRPPGHHAGRRRYGGYCFFNNAYVAAHELSQRGRCAVLDLDYHIGDGSIEFACAEQPYFSLHADPWRNYPYLERDQDLALPHTELRIFPAGIDGQTYLELARELIEQVRVGQFESLVVSMGFDTLGTDYIQDEYIYLVPDDYAVLGQMLAELKIPTLYLLEGGYDVEQLGACAQAFATGIRKGSRPD